MIEKLIKNRTPYLGKMILKFEKYSHYSSSQDGKLNKVHLNLGFTKLVSRFIPNKVMDGSNVDPEKVKLIEKYTGGVIGTHSFGKDDEYTLEDSFLTKDGKYIGGIDTAWWYFNNGMTVCEEYPHGVAVAWNTPRLEDTVVNGQDGIKGYYGYTHRGGALFKIGDRMFDNYYLPTASDYTEQEWKEFNSKFQKSIKNADEIDMKYIYNEGISSVIPFKKRGKKVIENWKEAREAAIALSKYLG